MYTLGQVTGLSMVVSPWCDIVMSRVYKQQVAVLQSVEDDPGVVAVNSVNPSRGPRKGGHTMFVTAWNLVSDSSRIKVEFVSVWVSADVRSSQAMDGRCGARCQY